MSGDNVDGTTNIIPLKDMRKLQQGYRYVIHQIYSLKLINKRVKIFLMVYNASEAKIRFCFKDVYKNVLAFLGRSTY